ncbi:MAG: dihydropteroate synthase [Deltaproteobacteria bacterium]
MKIITINNLEEAVAVFHQIGVDPYGIEAMATKTLHINVLLKDKSCKVANIIKQEMLSIGGDAAVARGSVACSIASTDVLIMGTIKQISTFIKKIEKQPFGLNLIAKEISEIIKNNIQDQYVLKTSKREIILGKKTIIMGILNVTPDSFSDGGLFNNTQTAVDRALQMIDEGADIIDIGGESSRPGAKSVDAKTELKRVIPIIEKLAKKTKTPISIDTTKAQVARLALTAGAEIINDISALNGDKKMAGTVKDEGAALILMHMRGKPQSMQKDDLIYDDLMGEIISKLKASSEKAMRAGIEKNYMVIDPGIGFGKTAEDNYKIIKNLSELRGLGMPIMIGASRKSFIGKLTGGEPHERIEGTAAAVTAAIINGAQIVRVHDVAAMKKVCAVTDAIISA